MSDLTNLISGLLAPVSPAAPQQPPERAPMPPATLESPTEASERPRRWRTLRTPDGMRPSPRAEQRAARLHAQLWYQALRDWETVTLGESVPRSLSPRSGSAARQMTPVVGNWGAGGVTLRTAQVLTPLGPVSESRLALLCNGCPLLSELRRGAGLAALIHASGRGWAGQRARDYGAAVLRLALALGDEEAASHLSRLSNAED